MQSKKDFYLQEFPDNRHEGDTKLRQAQLVMLRMLKIVDHICEKHQISYWLEAGTLLGAIRHQGFIPWDDDVDISMLREDFEKFRRIVQSELPEDMMLQTDMPSNEDYQSHLTDKNYFNENVPIKIRDSESIFIECGEEFGEQFRQGIFIDIFPYDNISSNKIISKIADIVSRKIMRLKVTKLPIRALKRVRTRYKVLAWPFRLTFLNRMQRWMIKFFNQKPTKMVGYGYDFCDQGHFPKDSIFPLTKVVFEDVEFSAPGNYHQFLTIKFGDYMQLLAGLLLCAIISSISGYFLIQIIWRSYIYLHWHARQKRRM